MKDSQSFQSNIQSLRYETVTVNAASVLPGVGSKISCHRCEISKSLHSSPSSNGKAFHINLPLIYSSGDQYYILDGHQRILDELSQDPAAKVQFNFIHVIPPVEFTPQEWLLLYLLVNQLNLDRSLSLYFLSLNTLFSIGGEYTVTNLPHSAFAYHLSKERKVLYDNLVSLSIFKKWSPYFSRFDLGTWKLFLDLPEGDRAHLLGRLNTVSFTRSQLCQYVEVCWFLTRKSKKPFASIEMECGLDENFFSEERPKALVSQEYLHKLFFLKNPHSRSLSDRWSSLGINRSFKLMKIQPSRNFERKEFTLQANITSLSDLDKVKGEINSLAENKKFQKFIDEL